MKNPHQKPIDELTGFEINSDFDKFDQRDEIYCRSEWDEEIRTEKALNFFKSYFMPNARARKTDGFSQRDYALRNAAWHVTNVLRDIKRDEHGRKEGFFNPFTSHDEGWPEPFAFASAEEATSDLHKVAKLAGADVVGVCAYDDRWMYSKIYDENSQQSIAQEIPDDLPHVIVLGESMDEDLTRTVPSALSGTATGLGYSNDAVTLLTLTQYIRNLGYRAHASMNDSSLAIPLAVQAGLGEVGRHSLLITEEYGPRLRLGRIHTDMPLVLSTPKKFGVKEFCEICDRCAAGCPPKAITFEEPTTKVYNRSNLIGVSKWTVDAEKCFKFWANQNTDCSICIRTCPYNRDYGKWYNRAWRKLAGGKLRHLALWLDDKLVQRTRFKSTGWWGRTG
ncbi:reductive dehalogenase [Luminiphilus syltensis NOR5-1B]|uniref:Reductive dehalogenase n=1 Tax=Luminiphilus syltensis NOR5-1B TaxID=565045 RepID=B8KV70_9GAMM|nr:reductive dehalogenase domain-containing protein [Luminiphilus syltensis]EED36600.1 reductive dehalogenase [Luminiphilus syltensis NOR5-1B]